MKDKIQRLTLRASSRISFFDIICNDELIKTLIQEIKRNQKSNKIMSDKKDVELERNLGTCDTQDSHNFRERCHTYNNHSTCDDNDIEANISEESIDDKETSANTQRTKYNNEVLDEENAFKDLNELMDYINEDDRNSPRNKNNHNLKTHKSKKKKKSKKILNNTDYVKKEKLYEDKSVSEFKVKLESVTSKAKEIQKNKTFVFKKVS